ncbi:MAG: DUF1287 domain-containing protein [Firmicutes bacterium]|nr:DUF1287 domain-containing protein [Bacillota bacterium]
MPMTSALTRKRVVAAARAMIGRRDVDFGSTSPAEGLVCIDVFVYACEAAGIPFRALMSRLYHQNPSVYPPDGGTPADVNFPRRIRNVIAFLRALGLWFPNGPGLPGRLVTFGDGPGEPAHSGVVSEASSDGAMRVIMTTGFGGPLAVREVELAAYLRVHPEFFIAGYGEPPEIDF